MGQQRKTLDDFPHFIVSEVQPGETFPSYVSFKLVGRFDNIKDVRAGRSWLLQSDRTAFIGDLSSFGLEADSALFDGVDKRPPVEGAKLAYLSAYWQAHHVWMILDGGLRWEKIIFREMAAVRESFTAADGKHYTKLSKLQPGKNIPAQAEVVAGGWDHEHCELCNKHIDPGDFAYTTRDGLWVCLSCFEKYVEPKDLSFVNDL